MIAVEELNRRYGAPSRIVFHLGHCGYPEVVLANRFGTAEVALLGANVLSYRPTGNHPVLFRPELRQYARGESFHGGMPLCWPQFGKGAIEGMQPHGFASLMPFEVRGTSYSEEMTELTLGLKSDDETRSVWPYDFDLEYKISLSMKLNLNLTTRNTGKETFGYTAGFHPYLRVRKSDAVEIRGLGGCAFVDARDMSEGIADEVFKTNGACDHVFAFKPAARHEVAVIDPGLRRALAVASTGNSRFVVWNPGRDEVLRDQVPGDWEKFVCAEPVTEWRSPLVEVAPGGASVFAAAIQSVPEPMADEH